MTAKLITSTANNFVSGCIGIPPEPLTVEAPLGQGFTQQLQSLCAAMGVQLHTVRAPDLDPLDLDGLPMARGSGFVLLPPALCRKLEDLHREHEHVLVLVDEWDQASRSQQEAWQVFVSRFEAYTGRRLALVQRTVGSPC